MCFFRADEKASHLIYLQKGKSYFLQAATRGSAYLNETKASVGVVLPNDKKVFPISPEYLDNVTVETGDDAKKPTKRTSNVTLLSSAKQIPTRKFK